MQLATIIDVLQELAPPSLAEDWDNTGLLLGDPARSVDRALTCLTLTGDVATEAVAAGVQLVVTHHPLLFKPVQKLTAATPEGRTVLALLQHGIAVYSPHTSWDNAPLGINQQLAELFELHDIRPLRPRQSSLGCKIIVYVPESARAAVQEALWDAGAGGIGDYTRCSFFGDGTGTFMGNASTNPAIGVPGRFEETPEVRLEVLCPANRVAAALAAVRQTHPYEVPAIDVVPLAETPDGSGAGRVGELPAAVSLGDFVARVRDRLRAPMLQCVGDPTRRVRRVGIACGAAAEYLRDAHRQGCDVFLTGEGRFHAALEARDLGLGLVLAGHYQTERPAMERLAELLQERCEGAEVRGSQVERDPLESRSIEQSLRVER